MSEYRDIGSLLPEGYLYPYPRTDLEVNTVRKGLVYQATHRGDDSRLPYMNRSFISFSYGGKNIEDFDLIATISGDRINHSAYASFEDTVTTYDNLDGQLYWATHYKTNQLDFTLSTDGIDLKQLDNFLHWFKAGISRELILAEHPNRAIMARVSQPPIINLLPFEHEVEIVISSHKYKTKTTLYKGDIQLSLVMDLPHWYALVNILGKVVDDSGHKRYEDKWDDIYGNEVSIFASLDALKILYEDGIPLGSMIDANMLLGNGAYANVENLVISCIWDKAQDAEDFNEGEGAKIDDNSGHYGIIAGALVDANDNGIETLAADTPAYFFYSGTAPSPTIITFTLKPSFGNGYYISVPRNSYAYPNVNDVKYNTFTVEGLTELKLQFTTPNIFTSYNTAIKVFENYANSSNTWEKVREALRETVRHPKVREYAISVLNNAQGNASGSASVNVSASQLQTYMQYFIYGGHMENGQPVIPSATFEFNSKTGEAIGTFNCYPNYGQNDNSTELKEDVGDMLRSNYIIILDRNYPNNYGKIERWTTEHKEYSHRIMHDIDGGLTNIQILYKNMYL